MFVGDCCLGLCVKKRGMFEKKTLSLYSLYTDQSHKVNEDRSQNRVSNEYAREHTNTHVENKLENKKSRKSGEYSILLECLPSPSEKKPRNSEEEERPKVGENSLLGVETRWEVKFSRFLFRA